MDTQVAALIDAACACDRIHKTPLPFAYVVHRGGAALVLRTLPFATLEGFGWGEILVTALVAFVLLGIEEIGVEIEDPFGTDDNDLPLERFCETVERDMQSVVGPANASAVTLPGTYMLRFHPLLAVLALVLPEMSASVAVARGRQTVEFRRHSGG